MASLTTPAVVVGADFNGLGVIRSLGSAGVPVFALDTDIAKPTMRSRHARKRRIDALAGPTLIDELERVAAEFAEPPVLFLTQEASVETAAEHRDRLARRYRPTFGASDVLTALMHKHGFHDLAEQHGFPVPRTLRLAGPADLAAAAELAYPVILKPATKDTAYNARFAKAYRIASFAELETQAAEIFPVYTDLVVQEWIEGGDSEIYFCLQYRGRDGRPAAVFTGRKLRSWPPGTGGTASCTAAPDAAAELEAMTSAFFDAVGLAGMCGMEYKKDARSGRFVMVEPTVGRTDYQEEIATLHGINIPFAAYLHEIGLPAADATAPRAGRPVVWRDFFAERKSRARQPDGGDLSGLTVYDACWRAADPLPGLAFYLDYGKRRLGRLVGRGG